jgi:hypothetical protein
MFSLYSYQAVIFTNASIGRLPVNFQLAGQLDTKGGYTTSVRVACRWRCFSVCNISARCVR